MRVSSHSPLTMNHQPFPNYCWAIFTHEFVPAAVAIQTAFVPPTFPASKAPALLAVNRVTVVLAFIFLHEELSPARVAGVVCALAAIWLLTK